jgi:hypothetical protein
VCKKPKYSATNGLNSVAISVISTPFLLRSLELSPVIAGEKPGYTAKDLERMHMTAAASGAKQEITYCIYLYLYLYKGSKVVEFLILHQAEILSPLRSHLLNMQARLTAKCSRIHEVQSLLAAAKHGQGLGLVFRLPFGAQSQSQSQPQSVSSPSANNSGEGEGEDNSDGTDENTHSQSHSHSHSQSGGGDNMEKRKMHMYGSEEHYLIALNLWKALQQTERIRLYDSSSTGAAATPYACGTAAMEHGTDTDTDTDAYTAAGGTRGVQLQEAGNGSSSPAGDGKTAGPGVKEEDDNDIPIPSDIVALLGDARWERCGFPKAKAFAVHSSLLLQSKENDW